MSSFWQSFFSPSSSSPAREGVVQEEETAPTVSRTRSGLPFQGNGETAKSPVSGVAPLDRQSSNPAIATAPGMPASASMQGPSLTIHAGSGVASTAAQGGDPTAHNGSTLPPLEAVDGNRDSTSQPAPRSAYNGTGGAQQVGQGPNQDSSAASAAAGMAAKSNLPTVQHGSTLPPLEAVDGNRDSVSQPAPKSADDGAGGVPHPDAGSAPVAASSAAKSVPSPFSFGPSAGAAPPTASDQSVKTATPEIFQQPLKFDAAQLAMLATMMANAHPPANADVLPASFAFSRTSPGAHPSPGVHPVLGDSAHALPREQTNHVDRHAVWQNSSELASNGQPQFGGFDQGTQGAPPLPPFLSTPLKSVPAKASSSWIKRGARVLYTRIGSTIPSNFGTTRTATPATILSVAAPFPGDDDIYVDISFDDGSIRSVPSAHLERLARSTSTVHARPPTTSHAVGNEPPLSTTSQDNVADIFTKSVSKSSSTSGGTSPEASPIGNKLPRSRHDFGPIHAGEQHDTTRPVNVGSTGTPLPPLGSTINQTQAHRLDHTAPERSRYERLSTHLQGEFSVQSPSMAIYRAWALRAQNELVRMSLWYVIIATAETVVSTDDQIQCVSVLISMLHVNSIQLFANYIGSTDALGLWTAIKSRAVIVDQSELDKMKADICTSTFTTTGTMYLIVRDYFDDFASKLVEIQSFEPYWEPDPGIVRRNIIAMMPSALHRAAYYIRDGCSLQELRTTLMHYASTYDALNSSKARVGAAPEETEAVEATVEVEETAEVEATEEVDETDEVEEAVVLE